MAVYARVSMEGQTTENQLRALSEVAGRHGWQMAATFADECVSGAKGRDRRMGFDALYWAVARRQVDLVMAWSIGRLCRYLHVQGLETSNPAGRAIFGMLGGFAEFRGFLI